MRSLCCARAASGHAAAPQSTVMNSRRFTAHASRASNGKDTDTSAGRKAAALRHFNPVYVGSGSFTSLWLLRSTVRMSASHPKATESLRSSEMTLSARALNRSAIARGAGRPGRKHCPQRRDHRWRARCPVLRIEVSSTSPETGVADEHGYGQSAAPAHDRGHELAQAWCADAEEPHLQLPTVRCVSEAVP